MRNIAAKEIEDTVARLCVKANRELPEDVARAIEEARLRESWRGARDTLDILEKNMSLARKKGLPVCQDTGFACVFAEIGQDIHIDGCFENAVNAGVRRGYEEGFLRKSVVGDPLRRLNTGDNTPSALTVHLVPGDKLRITVAPKGFGSENMSRLAMLKPSDGEKGIKAFVVETVRLAGPNACPPTILGVGIGGTFDKVAYLAKRRFYGLWMNQTPILIMPRLKRNSLHPSMPSASAPRASAEPQQRWVFPLKPCLPMWRDSQWP